MPFWKHSRAVLQDDGSEASDRPSLSDFEMTDTGWRMTAKTAANYAPDSESAEKTRLGWIKQYTEANGCKGFEVTSRCWTKDPTGNCVQTGFSESVGSLTYVGTCQR